MGFISDPYQGFSGAKKKPAVDLDAMRKKANSAVKDMDKKLGVQGAGKPRVHPFTKMEYTDRKTVGKNAYQFYNKNVLVFQEERSGRKKVFKDAKGNLLGTEKLKKKKKKLLGKIGGSLKDVGKAIAKNPAIKAATKVALPLLGPVGAAATLAWNTYESASNSGNNQAAAQALQSPELAQAEDSLEEKIDELAVKYGLDPDADTDDLITQLGELKKQGKISPEDDAIITAYSGISIARASLNESFSVPGWAIAGAAVVGLFVFTRK